MQPLFYPQELPTEVLLNLISQSSQLAALNQELVFHLYKSQLNMTQQLMTNQKVLSEVLEKQRQNSDSSGSSFNTSQNCKKPSDEEEVESPFHFNNQDEISKNNSGSIQMPIALSRLRKKKRCKYTAYLEEEEAKETKKCETKNIIKNFVKSVFSFIRKQEKYRAKVLSKFGIEDQVFLESIKNLNDRVNTIQQLRDLWVHHEHCQIFRTISSYFLRRYYVNHIFNSRIVNFSVHLKYRVKLLQSLKHPHQFTVLKDF